MMSEHLKFDTLRLGLYEVGYERLTREWNYPRLSSPFSRIYLFDEGQANIRHSGQMHHLSAGDLHLVPCHVTADYSCPDAHTQFFVGFTARLETGSDLFSLRRCDPTLTATDQHRSIFLRLNQLMEPLTGDFGRLSGVDIPLAVHVEARGLVLQLAAAFLATAHEPTEEELEQEGRFAPILQYVEENLRRDITLETLAELAGLTPTYFSDLFAKTIGVRPVEFINRRRVERAQLLLGSTELSMQEIADSVGIHSAAYFSRLFRRVAGLSPRRYRQMLMDV